MARTTIPVGFDSNGDPIYLSTDGRYTTLPPIQPHTPEELPPGYYAEWQGAENRIYVYEPGGSPMFVGAMGAKRLSEGDFKQIWDYYGSRTPNPNWPQVKPPAQPKPTFTPPNVQLEQREHDITINRNLLIALLRACGGHVTLDEFDIDADNRDVLIEFVTYQDPRRYGITLQEPE